MLEKQNVYLCHMSHNKNLKIVAMKAFITNWKKVRTCIHQLNGIAKSMDTRSLQQAFNLIIRQNDAHDAVDIREKRQATINLQSIMKAIWRRNMTRNLYDLKNGRYKQRDEWRRVKTLCMHWNNRSVRDAFNKWKKQATYGNTVIEVNEIGPVVEEVLEHRLDVNNLKDFMRKEGLDPDQVREVSDNSHKRVRGLMAGAIGRMQ